MSQDELKSFYRRIIEDGRKKNGLASDRFGHNSLHSLTGYATEEKGTA